MSDREARLRKRIDWLLDEKDTALKELWESRERIDVLERRVDNLHSAKSAVRRSRDMWRQRAQVAERANLQLDRKVRDLRRARAAA